jgi:hypothetical protein
MKDNTAEKKPYERPQMSVMRINRFFLSYCFAAFPDCYSMYVNEVSCV